MRTNQKAKGLICGQDGCLRPVVAKGLCRLHYQRAYQGREMEPLPRINNDAPCAVVGCERPTTTAGLCGRHYHKKRRYGDPLAPRPSRIADRVIPRETSPTKLAKMLGVTRQRAHQLLNRDAHNARVAVRDAVRVGQILKPDACERCQKKTSDLEAHHWDYHEVLDVRWVCPKCHAAIHPHHPFSRTEAQEESDNAA